MTVSKNYAIGAFRSAVPAPKSYYFYALAMGFVSGAVMEYTIIKSDYYQVIKDSHLRDRAKQDKDLQFYNEYKSSLEKD